ncbi:hypothetical protein BU17DRAFT_98620 [Hysterangium stoloniferum]|nr:hypothetical protein BU17DRAFT_98620 [Hysterangium stoloniferum]
MRTSSLPLAEEGRESQLLRASVIETAMTLGPKVTDLIFDNRVVEEDIEGEYKNQIPILEIISPSASSDESHSFDSPSATPESDYYLDSPFVMINEGNLPTPDVLAHEEKSASRRKSIKDFRLGRKRNKRAVSVLDAKQLIISAPLPILPSFDDPVVPSLMLDYKGSTPESSPLESSTLMNSSQSNTPQIAPTKRRKINRERRDWDFKDPDRPSFFLQQQYEIDSESICSRGANRNPNGSKLEYDGKNTDQAPENTGLRFKSKKGKGDRNFEETRPLKRSMSDRIKQTGKWLFSDYVPPPKSISKSLPPYERFTRKQPQSVGTTTPSPSSNSGRKSSLPTAESSSQQHSMLKSSASSVSSFVLFPDLNAAKRLGLDKYTSNREEGTGTGGLIGVDNKVKLEMLAKLLNEHPSLADSTVAANSRKSLAPTSIQSRPAPPRLNAAPFHHQSDEYHSPPVFKSPAVDMQSSSIQGRDSPLPVRIQKAQSLVRGREAPFPTKPIFRVTPRSKTLSPHLLVPPQRYANIDVPRSVRSTFTKDMELEEDKETDERERKQSRQGNGREDLSVYSNYSEDVNDDSESRASLMDAERSEGIRAMLMKNLSEPDNKRAYF